MLVPSEAFSVRVESSNGAAHLRLLGRRAAISSLDDLIGDSGWYACLACGRYA